MLHLDAAETAKSNRGKHNSVYQSNLMRDVRAGT
jgi:hypothetical protein